MRKARKKLNRNSHHAEDNLDIKQYYEQENPSAEEEAPNPHEKPNE